MAEMGGAAHQGHLHDGVGELIGLSLRNIRGTARDLGAAVGGERAAARRTSPA